MAKAAAAASRPLDVSDDAWAEAVRRDARIRPLAAAASSRIAIKAAAMDLGLSTAHIYRLIRAFRAQPVTRSLVVTPPGPKRGSRRLPEAIERLIETAIDTVYKSRERPNLRKLQREIRTDCRTADLKPPSRKAIRARVNGRSPKELIQGREGAEAARQRFVPVAPGLRPRSPLAIVQIDHTKVDIQLVDERTRAVLGRPWLTLLLDVFSRSVLGLHLSFDPPSAAGVALAVAQGVLPKTEWLAGRNLDLQWSMHGVPRSLHLDNAQEFHSRALKRGCQQHGIQIDYRPPATPRFGGHIERLMGTLMTRVHAFPGTTFSNVAARGDYPSEQKAVLTLGEFERLLALEVLGPYHNEVHSALSQTPAAAWALGIAGTSVQLPADATAFVLDFLPFEERIVRRDGVRLFNVVYYDGTLAPLLDSAERKCRVKYNPRDMSAVFVEVAGRGHLRVPCADLGRPPMTLWEQRAAAHAMRMEGRATVDEAAITAAVLEQRRVLAEAQSRSKAARRAIARLPEAAVAAAQQSPAVASASTSSGAADEPARVPAVAVDELWRLEFLS
jgi:putative transposase